MRLGWAEDVGGRKEDDACHQRKAFAIKHPALCYSAAAEQLQGKQSSTFPQNTATTTTPTTTTAVACVRESSAASAMVQVLVGLGWVSSTVVASVVIAPSPLTPLAKTERKQGSFAELSTKELSGFEQG